MTGSAPMVLIWGDDSDPTSESVVRALDRLGTAWIGLQTDGFRHTGARRPTLRDSGWLEDITAVLVRPGRPPDRLASSLARRYSALCDRLWSWLDASPALVLNRPRASLSNEVKPLQLSYLKAAGLEAPQTLVTTDPRAAAAFARSFEAVVVKSVSGERSIVRRYAGLHETALERIVNCPTMFQEFIPGSDVRVHVVGDAAFAHAIESDAVDYRYAGRTGHDRVIRETVLPARIERACLEVSRALDLTLAGIDLRRSPDGRWFAFEANPAPAFAFFEAEMPIGIADAVAQILSSRALG